MKRKYPSKTFFTADNHFGHAGIIKHCNRPWDNVDEMNEGMIDIWNAQVPSGSTVYIIGDFAYSKHAKFANRLNGKKILIMGNHDKMSQDAMKAFTDVHTFGVRRRFFGQAVTLCHYNMNVWQNSHYGDWQLYGHSHGRIKEEPFRKQMDMGVDVWDFKPVPFEVVKHIMDKKYKKEFSGVGELERNVIRNRKQHLAEMEDYHANNVS